MRCGSHILGQSLTVTAVIMVSVLVSLPVQMMAQVNGNPASYNPSSQLAPSTAYVDASVFAGNDICAMIYSALQASTTPSTGVVIDARGINSPSLLNCGQNDTPWVSGSTSCTVSGSKPCEPSTILLPAGTISITQGWVLPNHTKIVGEGSSKTAIAASASFPSGGNLIMMGSSSLCPLSVCVGVEVADLALLGESLAITGILNQYSENLSSVRNISITGTNQAGLWIQAANSGPYANISYTVSQPVGTTECVFVGAVGVSIHGLSCTNTNTGGTPTTAVDVESNADFIEDVAVQGFENAVFVGASGTAGSDTLVNISGNTIVGNVVHLGSSDTAVTDVTVLGVSTNGATDSIKDEQTSTTLLDGTVAMYVLGEPVTAGGTIVGYTRFTSSPSVPTWIYVGNPTPNITPPGQCNAGSIATNYLGKVGNNNTMWVCTGNNNWTNVM